VLLRSGVGPCRTQWLQQEPGLRELPSLDRARSAILAAQRKTENTNVWLANLLNRRHPNIAAVALANKNVRTVWAMLAHGREFKANYVPARTAA
jgi:hypothetical protein